MRIVTYSVELDNNKHPLLVPIKSANYFKHLELSNPETITDMMNEIFHANALAEEYVWIISMSTRFVPLAVFECSHGSVNSSILSPREIFMRLLVSGASSFVLIHNHPSGYIIPSKSDNEATDVLERLSIMMNVIFADHVIIGEKNYYSYMEQGLLQTHYEEKITHSDYCDESYEDIYEDYEET